MEAPRNAAGTLVATAEETIDVPGDSFAPAKDYFSVSPEPEPPSLLPSDICFKGPSAPETVTEANRLLDLLHQLGECKEVKAMTEDALILMRSAWYRPNDPVRSHELKVLHACFTPSWEGTRQAQPNTPAEMADQLCAGIDEYFESMKIIEDTKMTTEDEVKCRDMRALMSASMPGGLVRYFGGGIEYVPGICSLDHDSVCATLGSTAPAATSSFGSKLVRRLALQTSGFGVVSGQRGKQLAFDRYHPDSASEPTKPEIELSASRKNTIRDISKLRGVRLLESSVNRGLEVVNLLRRAKRVRTVTGRVNVAYANARRAAMTAFMFGITDETTDIEESLYVEVEEGMLCHGTTLILLEGKTAHLVPRTITKKIVQAIPRDLALYVVDEKVFPGLYKSYRESVRALARSFPGYGNRILHEIATLCPAPNLCELIEDSVREDGFYLGNFREDLITKGGKTAMSRKACGDEIKKVMDELSPLLNFLMNHSSGTRQEIGLVLWSATKSLCPPDQICEGAILKTQKNANDCIQVTGDIDKLLDGAGMLASTYLQGSRPDIHLQVRKSDLAEVLQTCVEDPASIRVDEGDEEEEPARESDKK